MGPLALWLSQDRQRQESGWLAPHVREKVSRLDSIRPSPGRGIAAGGTSVSALEPELLFRGYPADEMTASGQFLETAFLLITGELPTDEQLADWQALLFDAFELSTGLSNWLGRVPESASLLDVLQAALCRQQLVTPLPSAATSREVADEFPRWLGFMTGVLAQRWAMIEQRPLKAPNPGMGYAGNLWLLLRGTEPQVWQERALNGLLVLCAEHGFSPATCAVRLAASAGSELLFALQAGLSVARGPSAAGRLAASLDVLAKARDPAHAVEWVRRAIDKYGSVAGFTHRVYRMSDPRTEILSPACRQAAEATGRMAREELAETIEQAVWEQQRRLPTLSWVAVRLADYLGFDQRLFAAMFCFSRSAGWAAHYAEQRETTGPLILHGQYQGPSRRPYSPERRNNGL
jgi:2-methylcitrate synthase